MKADAPARLRRLADYLGATVYNVDGGQQWYILHYGVGDVVDDPVGHSSWDCLGRLIHVALACTDHQGHGCTPQEVQDVIRCPYSMTMDGGYVVLVLPDGIDATTDAMLSRLVADDYRTEYDL